MSFMKFTGFNAVQEMFTWVEKENGLPLSKSEYLIEEDIIKLPSF